MLDAESMLAGLSRFRVSFGRHMIFCVPSLVIAACAARPKVCRRKSLKRRA